MLIVVVHLCSVCRCKLSILNLGIKRLKNRLNIRIIYFRYCVKYYFITAYIVQRLKTSKKTIDHFIANAIRCMHPIIMLIDATCY
ncbi:hypothetical protein BN1088_870003 [Sphingobacterium sp. PM2-P1-29]|nr:hypothetical protein BN1088_870003 [Sphingobacterium sp. PM2-P1-29]